MATTIVTLAAETWTEISTGDFSIQVTTDTPVYLTEQGSEPSGINNGRFNILKPFEVYSWTNQGGTAYAYAPFKDARLVLNIAAV